MMYSEILEYRNLVGLSSFPLSVILPSECVGVEKMEMAMILPSAHNIRILYFVLTHVIVLILLKENV